ncbi:MAG: hypothetical protein KDD62_13150, partial [Bdellovibrionales bacterium]|nr:hypothetical protein [Bdellovibrionales bacterium]
AVVTPAAGTYPSPIDVDFAWTPDLNDGGTSTTFVATFSDGVNPSIECPATIRVPQNEAPTCQITGAQQDLVCTGNQTRIELDGLKSLDPEGADLTYAWSIECNGPASLEDTSGPTTALVFTDANASNDVECSISLVVSDGLQSSSCKATANISACPSCTDTSVADKLALLDGNTFTMSKLVKNLASELKRVTGKAAPKSVKDQVKQAKALHIEAWESINQVPSVIQSCVNANACVAVSHASAISVYKDDSADLLTLIKSVAKKVKAALKTNTTIGNRKRWQRIEKKGIRLNAQNIAEASALPEVNTVCP